MLWNYLTFTVASLFLVFPTFSLHNQTMERSLPLPRMSSADSLRTTLFLCGDVMTGRGIDQVLPHSVDPQLYESYVKNAYDYVKLAERENGPIPETVSYSYIWGDALEVWQKIAPDVKIINLETSLTDEDTPWPGKGINYRMHPGNVPVLTQADIDFCSLANNHTLDWGRSGLQETMQSLKQAGIAYAGAGTELQEAREPAVLDTPKGRVLVFAYGSESSGIPEAWAATSSRSGLNLLPDLSEKTVEQIAAHIKRWKQPRDLVVFSVHWGSNWGYQVPAEQRSFAQQLIDEAGVDLIHGHSSHHPRAMEVYREKLIMYGAGDFINDYEGIGGNEAFRDDLSLMYFPKLDPSTGKLIAMRMVPMQIQNFRLNHAPSSDAEWLQKTLDRESSKFGTGVRLNNDGSLSLQW